MNHFQVILGEPLVLKTHLYNTKVIFFGGGGGIIKEVTSSFAFVSTFELELYSHGDHFPSRFSEKQLMV